MFLNDIFWMKCICDIYSLNDESCMIRDAEPFWPQLYSLNNESCMIRDAEHFCSEREINKLTVFCNEKLKQQNEKMMELVD